MWTLDKEMKLEWLHKVGSECELKIKLKNELAPSRNKAQFFSYYCIFLFSSKLSDLRPWSQKNEILTNKITSLQISLLIQLSRSYISLSNIEKLIVLYNSVGLFNPWLKVNNCAFQYFSLSHKTLSNSLSFCTENFSINCTSKHSNLLVEERQNIKKMVCHTTPYFASVYSKSFFKASGRTNILLTTTFSGYQINNISTATHQNSLHFMFSLGSKASKVKGNY